MTEYFEVAPEKDLKSMDTFLEDWGYYEALKKLALENKTIDGYKNGRYFVKKLAEIDTHLKNYQGIYYSLEKPAEDGQYLTNKLIVFFMPADSMNSTNAEKRFFGGMHWDSLATSIAKNTYILRIADSNLVSGSYYQNTVNFPKYEIEIQNLIKKIAKQHRILDSNIICYGNSRGATGALYHGLLGNYKIIAADPVIDRRAWVEVKDMQHMYELVDYNFTAKLNQLLAKTTLQAEEIKVLSSDAAFITYPYIKQLDLSKFTLMNLNLRNTMRTDLFLSHAIVIGKSVPLQLSLINQFLYECDIGIEKKYDIVDSSSWDALLPWSSSYFELHLKDNGLNIKRNGIKVTYEDNLNLLLKHPLSPQKRYLCKISTKRTDILKNDDLLMSSQSTSESLTLTKKEKKSDGNIWCFNIAPKNELSYLVINASAWYEAQEITINSIAIEEI